MTDDLGFVCPNCNAPIKYTAGMTLGEVLSLRHNSQHQAVKIDVLKMDNNAKDARILELKAALREAYEIYAGSDGFIPETAAEGYQQQLIKQMVDIIGDALAKENTDLRAALEKTPEGWSHKNDGWR